MAAKRIKVSSCAKTHHLPISTNQITPKTFLNFDSHVKHSCNDNKFSEAINILCRNKRLSEAIQLLNRIDRPAPAIYSTLLQHCLQQKALSLGKKVHDHVENNVGFKAGIILNNRILELYCKYGCIVDARKVFDEMTQKNVFSWNIMVSGYAKAGDLRRARGVFDAMPERDFCSWTAVISGYVKAGDLKEARGVFDAMSERDVCTWNVMVAGYAQAGDLRMARGVFDAMPERDCYSWNAMISGYVKAGDLKEARGVFDKMTERDVCAWNIMVSGYAQAGDLRGARGVFDEMPERDYISWTAMISGYARHDQPGEALELFRAMEKNGDLGRNQVVVLSALTACTAMRCLRAGKEIHGRIVRMGLGSDEQEVWNSLLNMYGKCGSIDDARRIFDKSLKRDVVSWTMMIHRYFEDGRWEEGFNLFVQLLGSGIRPNEFTFSGVLNACVNQSAEFLGRQVHGHMIRIRPYDLKSSAANPLVHMYSRLGNVENAYKIFKGIPQPDLLSWTSLINGYAQNGQPHEALQLFELLLKSGNKPDDIIFTGVLSACTHAGLVDKGLEYFHSIKEKHGLEYTQHHYGCVIDLLGRSGRFKEAEDFIISMPMKPDKFHWGSLLNGCRIHRNIELAKRSAEALFQIEPDNPATYVTLASSYATAGEWDEVAKVTKLMNDKGIVMKPGLSWTEIKGKVHTFMAGDTSHPYTTEIYDYLSELLSRMKEEGCKPETDYVLHDVEEEQKEQNISYHSEKLAVAFGIIATPRGTTIKIFKNIRTCVDCHTSFKYISKIVERKIIVRDSTRFHCFEGGRCSCKDYW
ncbi:hypothetical protein AgCh_033505 [Apium graveolens]